jgi:amino acid adenylation domain-containing protein
VDSFALSFAQQRLWFLEQLEAIGPAYHLRLPVRLRGRLDGAALRTALAALAARHEALRTTVTAVGGEPRQVVHAALPVVLAEEDLPGGDEAALRDRLAALAAAPFDLAQGPLWRAAVVRLADADQVLLLVVHHLVADGWSMSVLFRDLAALYAATTGGGPAPLPALALQYADYAVWQRERLAGPALAAGLAHFRDRLAGAPDLLALPTDRPRPAEQAFRGSRHSRPLDAALTAAIAGTARALGATPFQLLLTAFQWLLARWSGQADIVVGTPVAGRPRVELEDVVGFFANTLAIRTTFAADETFAAALRRVRDGVLADLAHQDLPFEELVRVLRPPRTLRHPPVFQVLFALQNAPWEAERFGDLAIAPTEIAPATTARFDLSLAAIEYQGELWLHLEYNTDLFDAATAARLTDGYAALLAAAVAAPETPLARLPLQSPAARAAVLAAGTPAAVPWPAASTLGELVRAAIARAPAATAIVTEDGSWTGAALLAAVDRLAAGLAAAGAGPGGIVAVALPRTATLVATLLAVERTGAAWLPLDPAHPAPRRAAILADAGAALVVAEADLELPAAVARRTPAQLQAVDAPPPTTARDPGALLYLIYTSGSTGTPKGVRVPQRGVVNLLAAFAREPGLAPGDRWLALTTAAFDIAVLELFLPLTTGATLVLAPAGLGGDPAALAARLAGDGITACQATPGTWAALLDSGWAGAAGLTALVGGEALDPALAAALAPRVRALWNCYGPTETTVWSTLARLDAAGPVTVGRPIANTRCYVLDDHGEPVPVGVAGELWIGGVGVADGYHARPELTAARFRADPFAPAPFPGEPAPRVYATGDRARWGADGRLGILGRGDDQLKVRGFRIEPAEVEAALRAEPGVAAAVVTRYAPAAGDARLVGYLVPADGDVAAGTARTPAVLAALRTRLPDYLVPDALVWLPALPRNANGKLDRAALPPPVPVAATSPAPPAAGAEAALAACFAAVLAVPAVGRDTDFFAAGGHSLLAVRLLARLRTELALELPLKQLFLAPTVAALAAALPPAERARLATAVAAPPATVPATGRHEFPLAATQQRLWVLEALDPGNSVYHLCWAVALTGTLERDALQAAVAAVVARHAVLRTVFVAGEGDTGPCQRVQAAPAVPVEWLAMPGLDAAGEQALLAALARRPFDLATGPLLRVTVLATAPARQVLVLVVHHIVADGWSLAVLADELAAAYAAALAGRAPDLPPLPLQYGDWALWQREWLAGGELDRQLQYWRTALAGAPPFLDLGAARARPATPTHRGARHAVTLPPAVFAGVERTAAAIGGTPFMVLFGAFAVLLGRYGGTEDVVVGTPVAGRPRTELEGLVGFFVNTLVLRVSLAGNPTLGGLLARVRGVVLAALAHAELPFEKLVEALNPPRLPDRSPVFQVLFNFHTEPTAPFRLAGTTATPVAVPRSTTKFDLSLSLTATPAGLVAVFEYSTDLFDGAWIERFAAAFAAYVDALTAAGGTEAPVAALALPGSPPPVRRAVAAAGAAPLPLPLPVPLPMRLAARAAATPDALATVGRAPESEPGGPGVAWTVAELAAAAQGVVEALAGQGAGAGARVGVWCAPGVATAAALTGVMATGAVAVPLEPGWPAARLAQVAADAGLVVLVAEPSLAAAATAALPGLPLVVAGAAGTGAFAPVLDPAAPAYLLYTSGTTGVPKGVLQTHAGWARQVDAWGEALGLTAADALSSLGSVASDTALQDLGAALASGAALYPLDVRALAREALLDRIADARLTVLHLTPTLYRYLLGEHVSCRQDLSAVRLVVLGGEPARAADLALWRSRFGGRGRFVNGYGLTEATAVLQWRATATEAAWGATVPLGWPLVPGGAWLRDPEGGEASVVGELTVTGPTAAGYWSGGAVVPLADGAAGFATGDFVRRLPDGSLAYVGRRDDRVKIAGNRLELGEVTAALAALPGVAAAAVLAIGDPAGGDADPVLVAWYVPAAGPLPAAGLQAALRRTLPAVAVPARFVPVPALPRLANGKVDRAALRARLPAAEAATAPPPADDTLLAALGAIWAELLRRPVGPDDDFFASGGHSLLALRLITRVRARLGRELPLLAVFEAPTLGALAARLARLPAAPGTVGAAEKSLEIQRVARRGDAASNPS